MMQRFSCVVSGARSALPDRQIRGAVRGDVTLSHASGIVGMHAVSPALLDLVDVATAVYWVERSLPRNRSANVPRRFGLKMEVRQPEAWEGAATDHLVRILRLLGNADWDVSFRRGRAKESLLAGAERKEDAVKQVVLFSGGLDSTAGAATLVGARDEVRLVSFYTRQKSRQREIATRLGHELPAQFTMSWTTRPSGRTTFQYRSLLFLSLAAAVAGSFGVSRIIQFENGILASSVPPSDSWRLTRHAHPALHAMFVGLLAALTEKEWELLNPFLQLTKAEAVSKAIAMAADTASDVFPLTETCWYYWSNHIPGDRKRPGVPCGRCIPCLVRRTALPDEPVYDRLDSDDTRNSPEGGRAFRAYASFLGELTVTTDPDERYFLLPGAAHELVDGGFLGMDELLDLFGRFAVEFRKTFHLR